MSFKLRQCSRYNIPVVSPKYVDQCILKSRIVDTEPYRVGDINNNVEFQKGIIPGKMKFVILVRNNFALEMCNNQL